MSDTRNYLLILAAAFDAVAAVLHAACIVFGASWYRALGAGERTASLAEAGSLRPAIVTAVIATMLAIWALYALSGAGVVGRLPLLRPVLCAITGIYLLRGIAGFALVTHPLGRTPGFWIWSSAICLGAGIVHLLGLIRAWSVL